jgi:hypothetical protein
VLKLKTRTKPSVSWWFLVSNKIIIPLRKEKKKKKKKGEIRARAT